MGIIGSRGLELALFKPLQGGCCYPGQDRKPPLSVPFGDNAYPVSALGCHHDRARATCCDDFVAGRGIHETPVRGEAVADLHDFIPRHEQATCGRPVWDSAQGQSLSTFRTIEVVEFRSRTTRCPIKRPAGGVEVLALLLHCAARLDDDHPVLAWSAKARGGDSMTYWPLIPLFAGLLILGGCMLYTRSKRQSDGQPFQGRTVVAIFTVISIGLLLYALIGALTTSLA